MLRRWVWIGLSFALLACGSQAAPERPRPSPARATTSDPVPDQARVVLRSIQARGAAPEGVEGGRHFGNFEHRLPERDGAGRAIHYQEWDLWPRMRGHTRGAERLVTGSDGRAWYTGDHYRTFVEVRP